MWKKLESAGLACGQCGRVASGLYQQPDWNPTPKKNAASSSLKLKKGKKEFKGGLYCLDCRDAGHGGW
jgi:hypothetical protein